MRGFNMNVLKALFLLIIASIFVSCNTTNATPEQDINLPFGINALTIETGSSSAFVLLQDGSLWGWGSNSTGQLGNGTSTDWSIPHLSPIYIVDDVAYVSAGGSGMRSGNSLHVMVIRNDGSLWSWGRNIPGQLGDGTFNMRSSPGLVMEDVIAVSAGGTHTMAIRSDGTLWAWGCNCTGKLGDGTFTSRPTPIHIMDDVIAVSAGLNHTLALKTDGTLWQWGVHGRIPTETSNVPVMVMTDVVAMSAGGLHSLAICRNDSLWGWGQNHRGQLGIGTFSYYQETPVHIMDDVITASAGYSHSAVIKSDNSLWTWGYNHIGQLGDGTLTNRNSPVHILDNVSIVATGSTWHSYNIVIKTDHSIWAWGDNFWGQLGDRNYGTLYNQNTPIEVVLFQ